MNARCCCCNGAHETKNCDKDSEKLPQSELKCVNCGRNHVTSYTEAAPNSLRISINVRKLQKQRGTMLNSRRHELVQKCPMSRWPKQI